MQSILSPTEFVKNRVQEESAQHGIRYSSKIVEQMIRLIDEKKYTQLDVTSLFERTSEIYNEMNLNWVDKNEPNYYGTISTLTSNNQPIACIQERTNSTTQAKFYILNEIKHKGEDVSFKQALTADSPEQCKERYSKFVSNRAYKQAEKEIFGKSKEHKVNEMTISESIINKMISNIEKCGTPNTDIKIYIDNSKEKFNSLELKWIDRDTPSDKGTISSLRDKNNNTIAYIQEKENKTTHKKFYTLTEIKSKGNEKVHKSICSKNNPEDAKDVFVKVMSNRMLKETEKELCGNFYKGIDIY